SRAKAKAPSKGKAPARPKRKAAPKAKGKSKTKTKAKTKNKAGAERKVAPKAKIPSKSTPKREASAKPKKAGLRPARSGAKTVVLFPEAAFGPALNCVGIAQQLKRMGHNPVFVCDKGFKGTFEKYGFEENLVDMSGGMSDEEIAKFWANFIAGHLPNFHLSPFEQIPIYVVPVWEAIVESAIIAEDGLTARLDRIKPDVTCVDNVILFPAIKRTGRPWVRIISCSENEVPDPDIPPHLSGCHATDKACFKAFLKAFLHHIRPTHARFNEILRKVGEKR